MGTSRRSWNMYANSSVVTCSEWIWKDSLKVATCTKRGKGIRRHLERNKQVPSNWQEFLHVDENKSELYHLISDRIVDEEFPGLVIESRDDEVLSSAPCDLAGLMRCTQEEVDTRMFAHATDGAEHGMNKILLRTVDTDVVVIKGVTMHRCIDASRYLGRRYVYRIVTQVSRY